MSEKTGKDEAMMQTFAIALQMEEEGSAFYGRATETCRNGLERKIFMMLKADEELHKDRIKEIHESIRGGGWADNWKKTVKKDRDLKKIFREMALKAGRITSADSVDLRALDLGIDLEDSSIRFYKDRLAEAEDPREKEFLRQMIEEEEGHRSALLDMKSYFSDPESWFRERERGTLDGA